ncbi:putative sugar phosphate/phosphate translocator [Panicum miliaceum]|uniref:Sugar phosphate/phosphate translocator n=1 Tax=Panicum miliaceum TaxID=4540 RepID=A0A3L6SVC9_PANMI|nr:putative sugar phosphate/phosphate translocator [Panicum miliaceum]
MGQEAHHHHAAAADAAGAGASPAASRLFTPGLVAAWYASNIGVLLLNKYLLSVYGFRYPVFLTACHMSACALLSSLAHAYAAGAPARRRSRGQLARVAVLGAVFCASVVAGNVSLRYLPVSFNQAVGATTPFFTAVLAYAVAARREACATYAALIPVVAGVVIATGGEPSFHLFGFIMCVGAMAGRALKTVLQGILLSSEEEKMNSTDLLRYMAPVAVILLVPATLIMEREAFGVVATLAREDPNFI